MSAALSLYRAVWGAGVTLRIPSLVLRGRRTELRERLGFGPTSSPGTEPLWIHAASVGETTAAEALLGELRDRAPRAIALSTMTRTGRARAEALTPDLGPFHAPLDAPDCVRNCLDRLRPRALVLLETELWPNLLLELADRGIPWAIASGRLTERSLRRPGFVRAVYRRVLATVTALGARTEGDAEEAATTAARSGWPVRRWKDRDFPAADDGWSILVVDAMGVLGEAYRRSHCALIGGSLRPFGGHSPLEAAAAGRPVLFGPHTEHCDELAATLEREGGAQRVGTEEELAAAVENLLRDEVEADRRGRAAHEAVAARGGAARRTVDWLGERGVLA